MNDRADSDRRVHQEIAEKLTGMINSGELKEGSLLPSERGLAEQFEVSRTSIREALLLMQSKGSIALRPRARARVTLVNNPAFFDQLSGTVQTLLTRPNGVADFQEARTLFECGLARYAARHASPKEVERLAVALAENKRAIGDAERFSRSDFDFHAVLAEVPRNPIFTALNSALSEWLMEQRTVAITTPIRGAAKRAYEGHEAIYEAVAAHSAEQADKAMADHLKTVSEFYWKAKRLEDGK